MDRIKNITVNADADGVVSFYITSTKVNQDVKGRWRMKTHKSKEHPSRTVESTAPSAEIVDFLRYAISFQSLITLEYQGPKVRHFVTVRGNLIRVDGVPHKKVVDVFRLTLMMHGADSKVRVKVDTRHAVKDLTEPSNFSFKLERCWSRYAPRYFGPSFRKSAMAYCFCADRSMFFTVRSMSSQINSKRAIALVSVSKLCHLGKCAGDSKLDLLNELLQVDVDLNEQPKPLRDYTKLEELLEAVDGYGFVPGTDDCIREWVTDWEDDDKRYELPIFPELPPKPE